MKTHFNVLSTSLRGFAALAVLLGLLAACGDTGEPTRPPQSTATTQPTDTPTPQVPASDEPVSEPVTSDLVGIRWKWEIYQEPSGVNDMAVENSDSYTLVFLPDGEVSIQADCNRVGGTYTRRDSALTIELGPSTMAFCGESSLDQLYLGFLSQVAGYVIQDAKLVLNLPADAGSMVFQNSGQAEGSGPVSGGFDLTSPTWQWSELVETDPPGQTIVPDLQNYTITFLPDAHFGYVADCNSGSGTYTIDGNNLTLSLGPSTLAECGPESLSQLFQANLAEVSGFSFDNGYLVLNLGDNADRMIFSEALPAGSGSVGVDVRSITLDMMGLTPPPGASWQPSIVPATPYDSSQPPGPAGLPEHIQINFGVTAPQDRHVGDPVIYIIPVAAYEQLWQESNDPSVSTILEHLGTLLAERPLPVPPFGMPVLPFEEIGGVNDLAVQGAYPDLGMGGVRFVGRFAQEPSPVTNQGLRYIYQGYSDDGRYLISFFYPVTTQALPASTENVSAEEQARLDADLGSYLEERAGLLNALAPSDWEPNLSTLDAVLGSLAFETINGGPGSEITNIEWRWSELLEADPPSQMVVPNPENYLLIFRADGQYHVKADCNSGSGMYALQDNSLKLQPDALTRAACGPDSLFEQYTTMLEQADGYLVEDGRLLLSVNENAAQMVFDNGGAVR